MRNLKLVYKIFLYHKSKGIVWFRLFGRGLLIKNTKTCDFMLYSQRNNLRGFTIGNIYINYLGK